MAKRSSMKRCLKGCRKLAAAHDRARCCAECMARRATQLEERRRAKAKSHRAGRAKPPPQSPGDRRYAMLFGSRMPSTPPGDKVPERSSRGAPTLSGVPPLRDAASDRQEARSIATAIASVGVGACNLIYPPGGEGDEAAARDRARAQCVAAIQALHTSATSIIDAATTGTPSAGDDAELDAALEELQRHVAEREAQAAALDQEKAEARRSEAEDQRRQDDERRNRNLMIGVGMVGLVAAAGVGYVVLSDDEGGSG